MTFIWIQVGDSTCCGNGGCMGLFRTPSRPPIRPPCALMACSVLSMSAASGPSPMPGPCTTIIQNIKHSIVDCAIFYLAKGHASPAMTNSFSWLRGISILLRPIKFKDNSIMSKKTANGSSDCASQEHYNKRD